MSQTRPESQFEPRFITETGLAAQVAAIVEPVIEDLGFQLVRVRISGQNGCTVQIMAERSDGHFTIDDCEKVSRALSPVFDVEDVMDRAYHLEISSPGLDRPLVRNADFVRAVGYDVKIELRKLHDRRKRFKGIIISSHDDTLVLDISQNDECEYIHLPFDAIAEAWLVMNDNLLRAALNGKKSVAYTTDGENEHGH